MQKVERAEGGKQTPNMKPIMHKEAQQLSQNALGSFSYFLPSGEQFTAHRLVNGHLPKPMWFIFLATDEVRFEVRKRDVSIDNVHANN